MINDENMKEIAKANAEKYVIEMELEKTKNDFINYLEKNAGDEIRNFDFSKENRPIIFKKPFRKRIRDFFEKITKIL